MSLIIIPPAAPALVSGDGIRIDLHKFCAEHPYVLREPGQEIPRRFQTLRLAAITARDIKGATVTGPDGRLWFGSELHRAASGLLGAVTH